MGVPEDPGEVAAMLAAEEGAAVLQCCTRRSRRPSRRGGHAGTHAFSNFFESSPCKARERSACLTLFRAANAVGRCGARDPGRVRPWSESQRLSLERTRHARRRCDSGCRGSRERTRISATMEMHGSRGTLRLRFFSRGLCGNPAEVPWSGSH